MKRKNIVVQFIQNGILILYQNNIIEYKLNSVDNYKVINKNTFLEELDLIINNLKINNTILTDNITIIIDTTYSDIDKENIKNIFKELSFNKINYQNILNIFKISNEDLLIDISNNNIKIYYLNEVIDQKIYFSKYSQILSIVLKQIIKNHTIKTIKLFGNNCNNKKIIKHIENITNANVYIYSQPNLFPIKLLTE